MRDKNVPSPSDREISIVKTIFGLLVLHNFWQNIGATVGSGLPHRTDFFVSGSQFSITNSLCRSFFVHQFWQTIGATVGSGSACRYAKFHKKSCSSRVRWSLTFAFGSQRRAVDDFVFWSSNSRRTVGDLAQKYYVKNPHARRTLANSFFFESPTHENMLPVETKRSFWRALKVSKKWMWMRIIKVWCFRQVFIRELKLRNIERLMTGWDMVVVISILLLRQIGK